MKKFLIPVLIIVFIFAFSTITVAQKENEKKRLVIAGAGPSTQVVELLAKGFMSFHNNYEINVPRLSIKHLGALKAVSQNKILLGRTGRPLSEEDEKNFPTIRELPIAKVKTGFAVRKDLGVTKLTRRQWMQICKREIQNWQDVGGPDQPIALLGRQKGESVFTAICSSFPFFENTKFIKKYDKEHQIISAINAIPGAIGFSSVSNLAAQKNLIVLEIEYFSAGLQVGLVYNEINENNETVRQIKDFVKSESWNRSLIEHDFLPL